MATPTLPRGVGRTAGPRPGISPASANGTRWCLSYRPRRAPLGAREKAAFRRPPSRLVAMRATWSRRTHDRSLPSVAGSPAMSVGDAVSGQTTRDAPRAAAASVSLLRVAKSRAACTGSQRVLKGYSGCTTAARKRDGTGRRTSRVPQRTATRRRSPVPVRRTAPARRRRTRARLALADATRKLTPYTPAREATWLTARARCWDSPRSAQGNPREPWLRRNSTAVHTTGKTRSPRRSSLSLPPTEATSARAGNTARRSVARTHTTGPRASIQAKTAPKATSPHAYPIQNTARVRRPYAAASRGTRAPQAAHPQSRGGKEAAKAAPERIRGSPRLRRGERAAGGRRRRRRRSSLTPAVALLVLLPAPAGTGVVAADLGDAHGLGRPGPGGGTRRGTRRGPAGVAVAAQPRHAVPGPRLGPERGDGHRRLHLHQVEEPDRLLLDVLLELLEERVALLLVLDEGVDLAVGPEPDPLAQGVHRREVVDPLPVERLQQDQPLELPHGGGADGLLLGLVGGERRRPQALLHLGGRAARELLRLQVGREREEPPHLLHEAREVPLLGADLRRAEGAHAPRDDRLDEVQDVVAEVLLGEDLAALAVDHLALHVHHVVVLEDVLTDVEVVGLHLLLGVLDLPRHERVLDGHVVLDAQALHDLRDPLPREQPHQLVVEGHVEPGGAGISLAPGAPPQLVIDAPGLVALGPDDVEPPQRPNELGVLRVGRIAAQDDVHAPAGHVGGDGHRPRPAGLGDDLGLLLVVLGVEDLVGDPPPAEHRGEHLALLDGPGSDEDGAPLPVPPLDLVDDRLELRLLGLGRAGHPRQLAVHPEVVLEGDGGEGLALLLDPHPLLGLDGLVEAVAVPPPEHQPARELVHDDDLPVLHHVLHVPAEQGVGPQRLLGVVHQLDVPGVREVVHAQHLLERLDALLREGRGPELLVHVVVALRGEAGDEPRKLVVQLRGLLHLAGDDEGRARLVDEDEVHLVHDGVVEVALDDVLLAQDHVVPQVVEAELVVRPVGDVGQVGLPSGHRPEVVEAVVAVGGGVLVGGVVEARELVGDDAHREPEHVVHGPHPARAHAGEVVVGGDEVAALPLQGVEDQREGGHQRLAFARLHLGDLPAIEHRPADELHVEVAEPQGPLGGLAHEGEGLGHEVLQGLAVLCPQAEFLELVAEALGRHGLQLGLEGVHLGDEGVPQVLDKPFARVSDQLLEQFEHRPLPLLGLGRVPHSRPVALTTLL